LEPSTERQPWAREGRQFSGRGIPEGLPGAMLIWPIAVGSRRMVCAAEEKRLIWKGRTGEEILVSAAEESRR